MIPFWQEMTLLSGSNYSCLTQLFQNYSVRKKAILSAAGNLFVHYIAVKGFDRNMKE